MILKEQEEVEEAQVGELEEIEASIDSKNIALILSLASKNLYSNPIGSIIRELTSNCYDANQESNSEKPILIYYERDEENDGVNICFKDNGIGISPDRFKNIYMNWFSSTKREDNIQIGGKGIGSKTPLSYQDQFEIETIHNNIKYLYILYKTSDKPKITLLSSSETNEESGTIIRIALKTENRKYSTEDDIYKFHQECIKQLSYFDNVVVKSYSWSYDNYFKIVTGKNFKYKSSEQPFDTVHICLGQVTYPLDWKILKREPIKCPIALRFEIGELDVTLSRENIEYNEASIKLIESRLDAAINELTEIYNNQSPFIGDLREYLRKKDTILDIKLAEDVEIESKTLKLKSRFVYEPLKDIEVPAHDFFFNWDITYVENGIIKKTRYFDIKTILSYKIAFIDKGQGIDKYNNILFGTGYLFKRRRQSYYTYCNELKIKRVEYEFGSIYAKWSKHNKEWHELGKAKKIYKFIKVVEDYIKNISVNYNLATPEWIKNYKKELLESSGNYNRKLEGKIYLYKTEERWKGRRSGYEKAEVGYEEKLETLAKFKLVLYKLKGERYNIEMYYNILQKHSLFEKIKIVIVSATNEKQLLKLDNAYHLKDLPKIQIKDEKGKKKLLFYNYFCNINLASKIKEPTKLNINKYSNYYYKIMCDLLQFKNKYNVYLDNIPFDISTYNNNKNYHIKAKMKELRVFLDKTRILRYIEYDCPLEYVLQIMKGSKINTLTKLNTKYYQNYERNNI